MSVSVVFMGTPQFAVPILQALIDDEAYDVKAVVTQPDRRVGRKHELRATPVKELAVKYGIEVLQPEKLSGSPEMQRVIDLAPDFEITAAFGQFLPVKMLEAAKIAAINVHGSLLPKYRGAAPIQYAIKDGEAESGVTIMLLDEGMDTGKMLKKAAIPLDAKETTGTLFDKLSILGAQTLLDVLTDLDGYESRAVAQDESQATYTAKITKEEARIDWSQDAAVLERLIRTLDPHPGAYTVCHDGKRLKIWAADVVEGTPVSYTHLRAHETRV